MVSPCRFASRGGTPLCGAAQLTAMAAAFNSMALLSGHSEGGWRCSGRAMDLDPIAGGATATSRSHGQCPI